MKVIKQIDEIQKELEKYWGKKVIGFVPTMGFLHEGHLSLVKKAKGECDVVVVSIYVNPKQFGESEDFEDYPRDFNSDKDKLENLKIDYIFYPDDSSIYPAGYKTYVYVDKLQDKLCGRTRPGHFKGVCTIVLKLFNIIKPNKAYFGLKDYQQYLIIKKMVEDLNLNIEIVGCPIVRESDGLAMSSRNLYLTPEQRKKAPALFQALKMGQSLIKSGIKDVAEIQNRLQEFIANTKMAKIDYIEILNADDLEEIDTYNLKGNVIIAIAAYFGKARLIDNIRLTLGPKMKEKIL